MMESWSAVPAGLLSLWKVVAALVWIPPVLAWLYALTCALFLPYFRECSWTTHLSPLVPRTTVLVAIGASLVSLPAVVLEQQQQQQQQQQQRPQQQQEQQEQKQQQQDDEDSTIFILLLLLLLVMMSLAVSVYFIRDTRVHVVEGGPAPQRVSMKGTVVLITGANTGIGKETAIQLAEQGATIILACRSIEKAQEAEHEITEHVLQTMGMQSGMPSIDVLELDLSSFQSVRNAATNLKEKRVKVDILILNAGVMMGQQVMTEDGYELTMQANHLGHFLLTRLLLDYGILPHNNNNNNSNNNDSNKKGSGTAAVLVVTSSTYSFIDKIDLDDLFCTKQKRTYTLFGQYEMSKLANILFTQELMVRYPQLFTAAIHPGLVRTSVVRNMPWYLYYPNIAFAFVLWTLQKTPSQGAWCTAYLAATAATAASGSSSFESGNYWVNRQIQQLWPCAKDEDGASKLWNDSVKYVGLDS